MLETGDVAAANAALSALAIYRSDPEVRARAEVAIGGRPRMKTLFLRVFD